MSSKLFKLSVVAASVATTFGAQAALYKVVEISESQNNTYGLGGYDTEYYGTAIEQGEIVGQALGCFDGAVPCPDFKIAAETRNWPAGISYREEVPFAMDNSFIYADYNEAADFEYYCDNQLGYATCDEWGVEQFNGYKQELNNDYHNSIAFIEGGTSVSTINAVINSLHSNSQAVGNKRVDGTRNQAFADGQTLSTPTGAPKVVQTHAWKTDGTYTVGSVSREQDTDGNGIWFYSKPIIWQNGSPIELGFGNGGVVRDGSALGQASIRDFYIDNTNVFYGVGYNTYSDQRMDATIYQGSTTDLSKVTIKPVVNAQSGDDYIYTNSVVSSINKNKIAVGSAKRDGQKAEDGAANNRLFYVKDVTNPTATYFSGGIFFNGSGGTIGAINDFNEVVGSIDATTAREIDGSPRTKRGFIYPLDLTGTDSSRLDLFKGKAWLLDDLTNGGEFSTQNNYFRILRASDINGAGVISATAIKCPSGYVNTNTDALCGDGTPGLETVVAVKLIPVQGATSDMIEPRGKTQTTVTREGGSFGWISLLILGVLGFRRK
ncbi:DUF3466 family protein [Vibrio sinensis]|uniref:DUF3466 family protein n=1 Tax=Vibrio sinensis TaxID=2302434 RepID=A0A3A6QWH1_9VIBR|nr:DUF3466 family protein [Vibrio sinensis]RJX72819.1 DUF3466 family protein [Vibrio sinensis]